MNAERFDELLEQMRAEGAPADQIRGAEERVWQRLAASQSPACEELRPELPGYVAGALDEPRRLLLNDHLSRCVDCRHALAELKGQRTLAPFPTATTTRASRAARWAIAAGIVLAVLYIGRDSIDSALSPAGPRATVVSVSGTLVKLSAGAVGIGTELGDGEAVRTSAGSGAVLRLDDGSLVEMNERTELSITGAWSGNTVRLERGDIVVEATDQGAGRLRVVTRDSIAAVRGTVFAVSSTTSGSLVSVVEGSVEVSQPGFEELLVAGQQAATTAALGGVTLVEAISWSSGANGYFELIAELALIEERLARVAGVRRQARLLPYLPSNTVGYYAIPNLEGAIAEALDLLAQRSTRGTVLDEWWSSSDGVVMREMLEHMQAITPMLGEEIVFLMTGESIMDEIVPLMMARVQTGREEELRAAIDALGGSPSAAIPYRVADGLLLVADSPANVALMAVQLGGGASSPFAIEIGHRYERGVGWLAAMDVRGLDLDDPGSAELGAALGVRNMSYLFLEQRTDALGDDTTATLMFDGPRSGIASWIAQPGPIGSAAYVSSQAIVAAAASTRDPRGAFDQLMALLGPSSEMAQELQKLEYETGISIGNDIADSLGTDFVIAIEQISVPIPGWIAAFEVLNPGALDEAMRRLVTAVNRQMATEPDPERVILAAETVNGRVWNSLTSSTSPTSLYWTYDRGYLVASTDMALALRAIGVRDSGSSLVRSSNFRSRYPRDGGLYDSGFFWLNTSEVADELAALVDDSNAGTLALTSDPVLVVLTGEADQVRWASSIRFTSFLLDLMLARPIGEIGNGTG